MNRTAALSTHFRARRIGAFAPALLLALLLVLIPFEGAAAQVPGSASDPFGLPDIVVTASQVPVTLDRLPTQVTVFTRESLEERGFRTVADALRSVPGVAIVSSGSAGSQTSVFLRGGESDYVKVLVDGVPMNEAGGSIDLADLSTDQIERIEVVRGPASVLHGSDAVTGVIQIFTVRGRGAPRLQVTATGGAGERRHANEMHGVMDAEATLSGSSGGVSYAVGGGHSWSSGTYPLNNENRLSSGSMRVTWVGAGPTAVGLSARRSDGAFHFPTDGSGNLADANQVLDRRGWSAGLTVSRALGSRLVLHGEMTAANRHQVTSDAPDGPGDTSGVVESIYDSDLRRRNTDLRFTGDLGRIGTLTLGSAIEVLDGEVAYESDGEFGPYAAGAAYERTGRALYAELLTEPVAGVSVTLGGRMDWNETFGRFDTYRLGLAWAPIPGTRLRGGIGRAFREPTFGENFGSGFFDVGNEDLVPERTFGWEVGAEQAIGTVVLSATWFDQRFEDLIQYTSAPPNPGDPNYYNVGAADAVGIELGAEGPVGPITFTGSYTLLHTEVLNPGLATDVSFVEGETLLRRPRHSATTSIGYERGSLRSWVRATRVGSRADADYSGFPATRTTLPAYSTVDVSLSYGVAPGGIASTLLLRVENLFDAEYEQVLGFPSPGRIVRLGARVEVGG